MSHGIRRPHEAVDYAGLQRFLPPPPEYFEQRHLAPPEEIESRQLARLQNKAQLAYQAPFHRKRWDAAGFAPGDLRSLDDLWNAPFYTVDDIRKSIEEHPPYGDYQGVRPEQARRDPMRVFMSGGTTGKSRPTLYTAWDREAGAILTARAISPIAPAST